MDSLEERLVPTIYWDGGGNNFNWSTAANWSSDVLPGSHDDVVIDFAANDFTVDVPAGTTAVRSLTSQAGLNVAGTLDLAAASVLAGPLRLSGTLSGAGNIEVLGAAQLGGTLLGPAGSSILFQGTVTFASLQITERDITFGADTTWEYGGNIVTSGSVAINNQANWYLRSTGNFTLNLYGADSSQPTPTIVNTGAIIKDEGDNYAFLGANITNQGSIDVQKGTIYLGSPEATGTSSGTLMGAAGTRVLIYSNWTLDGSVESAGTVEFSGAETAVIGSYDVAQTVVNRSVTFASSEATLGQLTLQGGGKLLTDEDLTVAGLFTWAGGTLAGLNGHGSLTTAGGMRIEGGGDLAGGFSLVNPEKSVTAWNFGHLALGDGCIFKNAGTIELSSDDGMSGTGQSQFLNCGILIKRDGSKAPDHYYGSLFSVPSMINTGTIDLRVGTLGLGYTGTYFTNSGAITADEGTTLWLLNGLNSSGSIDASYVRFHVADATITGTFRANHTELWGGNSTVRIPGLVEDFGDLVIGYSGGGILDLTSTTFAAGANILESLTLQGGATLISSANLTVAGSFTWNGTLEGVNGQGSLRADGGTVISGGGGSYLANGFDFLNPQGANVNWNNTYGIVLGDGSTFENAGMMELSSDAGMNGTGQSEFLNSGILIKSDGSKAPDLYYGSLFSVPAMINTGTIDLRVGTLGLGYTGTYFTNTGAITADEGTTLWLLNGLASSGSIDANYVRFHVADATITGTFRANHTELWGGSSTVRIPGVVEDFGDLVIGYSGGGTLDLTGTTFAAGANILDSLTLQGGATLISSANLTVAALFTWNGTLAGVNGEGSLRADGGTVISGGGGSYLTNGFDFLNPQGANVNWNNIYGIVLGDGSTFENAGILQLSSDAGMSGTGQSEFLNSGILIKSDGSKAPDLYYGSLFSVPLMINTGKIDLRVGTLGLGYVGTYFTNSGAISADEGTTVWLLNGLYSSGSIDANYVRFHVADATITGTYRANHTELWAGNSTVRIPGFVEDFGNLVIGYSGGGTLDLTGTTFAPGVTILDSLTLQGGATLITSANLTVAGSFTWNGTLEGVNGQGSLRANGGTVISGGGGSDLANGFDFLNPQGANVQWDNAYGIVLGDGSTFENAGMMELSSDAGMSGTGQSQFLNSGVFIKSGGSQAPDLFYGSDFAVPSIVNTGTIDLLVGTLGLGYVNTLTVNSGTIATHVGTTLWLLNSLVSAGKIDADYVRFHGADATITGSFRASRTELLNGSSTVRIPGLVLGLGNVVVGAYGGGTLDLSGATFAQGGQNLASLTLNSGRLIADGNLLVTGAFAWNGSTLEGHAGLGSLTVLGDMTLNGNYNLKDFQLINAADAIWAGGAVTFYGASRFTNLASATFDDQIDGAFGGIDTCPIFDNQGLFRKSGGSGTTFLHMQLYNSGSVIIEQGMLNIHCGYVQVSASSSGGGGITGPFTGDVSIENPGQYTSEPGPSTSTPVSSYNQTGTGVLVERIGGMAPGTQYGQIVVNGNVNLDGTLRVELINGFVPVNGSVFTVIDNRGANPIAGTFIGLPEGATVWSGPYRFTISYAGGDGNDLTLTFAGAAEVQLGGRAFEDRNANGQQDVDDWGIGGVEVKLSGTNVQGNLVTLITSTDSNGEYLFAHLLPGTYSVIFAKPASYVTTAANIGSDGSDSDVNLATGSTETYLLQPGESNSTVDAGYFKFAELGDFVWYDANANGKQDVGEAGIANVKVQLFQSGGVQVGADQFTDANGKYLFTNLVPGDYYVTFTTPAGYTTTLKDQAGSDGVDSDVDQTTGKTTVLTLTSGQSDLTWDAGYSKKGGISGVNFRDVTGNGLTSDDSALLSSFTIQLYRDSDNDGQWDIGNANAALNDVLVTTTTTSTVNGSYAFTGLAAGTYFVREVTPAGWMRTAPALADYYKVVVGNAVVAGQNFANFQKECDTSWITIDSISVGGTILTDGSGKKIKDLRGNTNQGDEVTVTFTVNNDCGCNALLTLVSYTAPGSTFIAKDAYKQEIFDSDSRTFGPGTYSLTVQNPNGFYQVDFVCGRAIDRFGPEGSNLFYSAQSRLISADNDGRTATPVGPASLAGSVYSDRDNDGVKDSGEDGIAGVKVTLSGKDALGNALTLVRTTRPDGTYSFAGLPASDANGYKLTESQPSDYNDGKETLGKVNGTAKGSKTANDVISSIKLAEGQAGLDYLFGELAKASISGLVYKDSNNDGIKDPSESGIKNVSIVLTGYDDLGNAANITVLTDASGKYSFSGLRPSDSNGYTIKEAGPSGYKDGKETLGKINGTAIGTKGADRFTGVTLKAGEDAIDYLFGELPN